MELKVLTKIDRDKTQRRRNELRDLFLLIHSAVSISYTHGIVVEVRKGRRKYLILLCELEVSDKSSGNYSMVDNYSDWLLPRFLRLKQNQFYPFKGL